MSSQVEIVLTLPQSLGPEMVYLARARTTLGALTQLVAQAQQDLVMAAPYISGETFAKGILQHALRHAVEQRHVELSIVTTNESLSSLIDIPWIQSNQARVRLFRPRSNLDTDTHLGSHAKFCLADERIAYIGSANLTFLGLHAHLEMGVLLQGEAVKQISDFWRLLTYSGFYVEDTSSVTRRTGGA